MTRKESTLTLTCIYIGTVVGAGFASGQEILQFFGKHGRVGILGVVISTFLFCRLASHLLQLVYVRKLNGFEDFLGLYFGNRSSRLINFLMTLLLFVGYIVMLAGGGAILKELFSVNQIYGILIMSGICFSTFIFGVKGIAKVNNFIVPILMIIVVIFAVSILHRNNFMMRGFLIDPFSKLKLLINLSFIEFGEVVWKYRSFIRTGWLWSAILYVSFNSLVVIVVITTLRPYIFDRKAAKHAGLIGGLGLGGMALLILICLLFYYSTVYRLEVPMIAVANSLGKLPKQVYSLILWLAMFTTAIANGYGCITNVEEIVNISQGWSRFWVCSISIPLAMIGFKELISFIYPILGYIGILFLLLIFFGKKN